MSSRSKAWKATCTPRQYQWLRSEDAFAVCVTLARALNQLRYTSHTIDGISESESPSYVSRQEFNTIFVACATLYEAIQFARAHVGRHFRSYPQFASLAAVWRDSSNRELLDRHIAPLRNQTVSHFDLEHTKRALADLTVTEECVFAVGRGNESRHIHHQLPDALAVMTLVGAAIEDTDRQVRDKLTAVVKHMAAISSAFIYAAEDLLGAIISDFGFVVVHDELQDGHEAP